MGDDSRSQKGLSRATISQVGLLPRTALLAVSYSCSCQSSPQTLLITLEHVAIAMSTTNYSFYAIPAMWGVSIGAHFYAASLTTHRDFAGSFDNVSPRESHVPSPAIPASL